MHVTVRLVLLLLSLTLPINGMAHMLMPAGEHKMMHSGDAPISMSMHAEEAGMGADDECFEHDKTGKSTGVCKSGQECKTSSLLQFSLGKAPLLPAGQQVSAHPSDIAPSLIPDAVWHPPRA